MSTSIRKYFRLDERQARQLKHLSQMQGVSESEVVRRLISAEAARSGQDPLPPDPAAWKAILQFIKERAKSGAAGEPYRWNREEIYEERMRRYDRDA